MNFCFKFLLNNVCKYVCVFFIVCGFFKLNIIGIVLLVEILLRFVKVIMGLILYLGVIFWIILIKVFIEFILVGMRGVY